MRSLLICISVLATAVLGAAEGGQEPGKTPAEPGATGGKAPTEAPAEGAAKPKPYTLKTCIVSGEELGSMGKPVSLVHNGQEVKFCCKSCIKDFKQDPDAFVTKAQAQAKEAAESDKAKGHKHDHGTGEAHKH